MKIAIFDVDDTLIKHAINSESYYTGTVRSNFKDLLSSKNYEKVYLYTNGTYEHGRSVAKHLGIIEDISYIYARDNLKTELKNNHMKPSLKSFNFVNKSIEIQSREIEESNEIFRFDILILQLSLYTMNKSDNGANRHCNLVFKLKFSL